MFIIRLDVLSKLMVKTRFRGETAVVNVEDFVVTILSLSLGVGAVVLLFALVVRRDFTILLFVRDRGVKYSQNSYFVCFTSCLVFTQDFTILIL